MNNLIKDGHLPITAGGNFSIKYQDKVKNEYYQIDNQAPTENFIKLIRECGCNILQSTIKQITPTYPLKPGEKEIADVFLYYKTALDNIRKVNESHKTEPFMRMSFTIVKPSRYYDKSLDYSFYGYENVTDNWKVMVGYLCAEYNEEIAYWLPADEPNASTFPIMAKIKNAIRNTEIEASIKEQIPAGQDIYDYLNSMDLDKINLENLLNKYTHSVICNLNPITAKTALTGYYTLNDKEDTSNQMPYQNSYLNNIINSRYYSLSSDEQRKAADADYLFDGITRPQLWAYDNYLKYFQLTFNPEIWRYDHYPFRYKKDETPENTFMHRDSFFYLLQKMRSFCNSLDRPFQVVCSCLEEIKKQPNGLNTPVPTIPMLRIQTFCALAYGAQGIAYWLFANDKYNKLNNGSYFMKAPLVFFMNDEDVPKEGFYKTDVDNYYKTDIFNSIKAVNSQIRKYEHIFLGCKVIGILGKNNVCDAGFVREIEPDNLMHIRTIRTPKRLLFSMIHNNGIDYIVVINTEFDSKADFDIFFNTQVKDLTTNIFDSQFPISECRDTLEAGDWKIFQIV